MLKTFLQHIAVVLCKKRHEKTANITKMRAFSKLQNWPPSKGYSLCKILTLGQKLQMQKNMLKMFLQHIAVVLCKKRHEKTANITKMREFSKLQNLPPSKAYSLCKILTLGQKLKMEKNMLKTFLQHIGVVLCKKRHEKTANITKMRGF